MKCWKCTFLQTRYVETSSGFMSCDAVLGWRSKKILLRLRIPGSVSSNTAASDSLNIPSLLKSRFQCNVPSVFSFWTLGWRTQTELTTFPLITSCLWGENGSVQILKRLYWQILSRAEQKELMIPRHRLIGAPRCLIVLAWRVGWKVTLLELRDTKEPESQQLSRNKSPSIKV